MAAFRLWGVKKPAHWPVVVASLYQLCASMAHEKAARVARGGFEKGSRLSGVSSSLQGAAGAAWGDLPVWLVGWVEPVPRAWQTSRNRGVDLTSRSA